MPALAACGSTQTATVASGGQVVFECALFGFKIPSNLPPGSPPIPAADLPQHGALSEGTSGNVFALVYTNNGDGALSDTFVLDSWDNPSERVTFTITVQPASGLDISPTTLQTPGIGVAYSQSLTTTGGTATDPYTMGHGASHTAPSVFSSGDFSGNHTTTGRHTS